MACVRWSRHSRCLRRSLGTVVLAGGFAILLALSIGLLQLTHSAPDAWEASAAVVAAPTPPAAPAAAAAPVAQIARSVAAREPRPVSPVPGHVAMPDRPPELPAAHLSFKPELKRDANGKLVPIIAVQELRRLMPPIEAPMRACVERAGRGATGKATLNFTVAAKGGKLFVESTGVQDDETLAAYPELLDCMHRTANALVLDGRAVPELGTPVYVRRSVRVENGVLADDSLVNFSYSP